MSATAERTDRATLIGLRAEFTAAGIEEFLAALDRDLIGSRPVKARIRDIASLPLIERVRQLLGFTTDTPRHMSFTSDSGTGKTTVAPRMAAILNLVVFPARRLIAREGQRHG